MNIRFYRYPGSIKFGKMIVGLMSVLFVIIIIFVVIEPYFRQAYSDHYSSLVISLILGIIGCIFYIGCFSDIGVDDDGLLIEFFGKQYRVFWMDITGIKPFRPGFLNYWVITTDNKLTPFHRLYGLYSLKSLAPSFCIYKTTKGHEFLLMKIKEQVKLNNKTK